MTTNSNCEVSGLVGPKSDVQITSQGNDLTKSESVSAVYAPLKPVTALVVHFATNSSVLNSADKAAIKKLADTIKLEGFKNLIINGHTDIVTGVDNKVLSLARAKATLAYLNRLAPDLNAKIAGFASTKPAAQGHSAVALADNRRAEIGLY
jgi:outer membrane protein OmpA-like peptidoglycan-associated protein